MGVDEDAAFPDPQLASVALQNVPVSPRVFANALVTAIAMVKAANMDSLANSAVLSPAIADYSTIPAQWRGYAAVALQKGFVSLDGNQFNPNRSITRIELSRSVNALIR